MTRLLTLGAMVFAAVALCVWGPSYGSATDGWPRADESVVPYADLPPAGETIPATFVPRSPEPAPAGTPSCRAKQLAVRYLGAGAAAGTAFASYRFRLVSGHACALQGTPHLTALQDGRPVPLTFEAREMGGDFRWRAPVLVDRTHRARIRLAWGDALWCAPPIDNTGVLITLPSGDEMRATGLGRFDTCGDPDDPDYAGSTTTVWVGHFKPAHITRAHRLSAWNNVKVQPPRWQELEGAAGATVHFQVTLISRRHDTSLAVCPDFSLSGLGGTTEKHQLNCAGVTTVDAEGVPYLPAGVPVTFDDEIVVPATSVAKLLWQIREPGLLLIDSGSITVRPPTG